MDYCTISNNSARGTEWPKFWDRPPILAMANLANQFRAEREAPRDCPCGQSGGGTGDSDQNHKARDKGLAELFKIVQYQPIRVKYKNYNFFRQGSVLYCTCTHDHPSQQQVKSDALDTCPGPEGTFGST